MASDEPARDYRIIFARSARQELARLPSSVGDRILRRIEDLAAAPRPRGSRKLVGAENLWRLRVGNYRVIYSVNDGTRMVDVIAVRDRKDAYQ